MLDRFGRGNPSPSVVEGRALTAKDGRLSGEAERGKDTPYTLLLSNDGTAPLDEVEMSGTVPPSWKVEFNPKTIPTLAPNQKMEVQAVVTPGDKTIDFEKTFSNAFLPAAKSISAPCMKASYRCSSMPGRMSNRPTVVRALAVTWA